MIKHAFAALSLAAFAAACSSAPAATPAQSARPADPVGATRFYVRSNQDGSQPERIIVHRETGTRVAVSKQVERCTNAAYVTADFDLTRGEATGLVGGRLTRELTQDGFATIVADLNARSIQIDVPVANVHERLEQVGGPWRIYDFDLADLSVAMEGRPAPTSNFGFFVTLAWPEDTGGPFVTNRGVANAAYVGEEQRQNRATQRFDVSGALNGQLWLDARDGFVVEARFAEPNHPGYDNFALVLQNVVSGEAGRRAWRDALAAHWEGCP